MSLSSADDCTDGVTGTLGGCTKLLETKGNRRRSWQQKLKLSSLYLICLFLLSSPSESIDWKYTSRQKFLADYWWHGSCRSKGFPLQTGWGWFMWWGCGWWCEWRQQWWGWWRWWGIRSRLGISSSWPPGLQGQLLLLLLLLPKPILLLLRRRAYCCRYYHCSYCFCCPPVFATFTFLQQPVILILASVRPYLQDHGGPDDEN